MALTDAQKADYLEKGFVVVENVIPLADIEAARAAVDEFVERSRAINTNDEAFDLEPGHTADAPRLRRLKNPCLLHPAFQRLGCSEAILDRAADLIGSSLRYQTSKLNVKAAAYGSPIEWHQDFAFYPHTNDDLLAVGVALDDCAIENGCMQMIPGSHRGPVLDHHQEGVFVGAVDPVKAGVDLTQAVYTPVQAGGITLHHCRTLHASAPNTSARPRRILFIELCAVDAWPVLGVPDLAAFDGRILRGRPTRQFRVQAMDIRIPLPKPEQQGSIYEIQTLFANKTFAR